MIDLSEFTVAGIITKTHGVHGQVLMQLSNLSFEDILKLESVMIEIDGLPVPFFINTYTSKNISSVILDFEDVNTEEKAIELLNKKVLIKSDSLIENTIVNPQTEKFKGYIVIDKRLGEIGVLEEILEVQNNPLLRVLKGKKEILIPFQQEFIVKINDKKKIIKVNTPSGLTELFD